MSDQPANPQSEAASKEARKSDGGPAFPTHWSEWTGVETATGVIMGMSVRDVFAASAMAAFITAPVGKFPHQTDGAMLIRDSFLYADEALAYRAKAKP